MSKKKRVSDSKHVLIKFDVDKRIIDCPCPRFIYDELTREQFNNLINMLKVVTDNLEYILYYEVKYEFEK